MTDQELERMCLVEDGRHNIKNGTVQRLVVVNKRLHLFRTRHTLDDKIAAVTNTPTDPTLTALHSIQDKVLSHVCIDLAKTSRMTGLKIPM